MKAAAVSAVCAALVAGACGGAGKQGQAAARGPGGEPRYLELVPADTPYVFATAERPPKEPIARELAHAARDANRLLREREREREIPIWERLVLELLAELDRDEPLTFDEQALAGAGVRLDPHLALYGLGAYPAARVELLSGRRFGELLGRILERADVGASEARLEAQRYFTFPIGRRELVAVVAVVGDDLVAALLPEGDYERLLPLLFGTGPPDHSLAATGALAEVIERHGFAAWSAGFVDLPALLRALVAPGGPLADGPGLDPACAEEIPRLASAAPRVVFGTHRAAGDRVSGAAVVELRADVAAELLEIASAVPGMTRDDARGAALAFGAGVDLGRLLRSAEIRLAAIASEPYRCPLLRDLNQIAGRMTGTLRNLRTSALAGVTGVSLLFHRVELDDAGAPRSLEGFVFLGARDPAGLLALAAGLLGPQLATLTPGGPPARLVLPGYGALLGETHLAAGDRAVGISIGAGSEDRLADLLARRPDSDPPFLLAHVDPELLGRARSELGEAILLVGRATGRGLELRFEATYGHR